MLALTASRLWSGWNENAVCLSDEAVAPIGVEAVAFASGKFSLYFPRLKLKSKGTRVLLGSEVQFARASVPVWPVDRCVVDDFCMGRASRESGLEREAGKNICKKGGFMSSYVDTTVVFTWCPATTVQHLRERFYGTCNCKGYPIFYRCRWLHHVAAKG